MWILFFLSEVLTRWRICRYWTHYWPATTDEPHHPIIWVCNIIRNMFFILIFWLKIFFSYTQCKLSEVIAKDVSQFTDVLEYINSRLSNNFLCCSCWMSYSNDLTLKLYLCNTVYAGILLFFIPYYHNIITKYWTLYPVIYSAYRSRYFYLTK